MSDICDDINKTRWDKISIHKQKCREHPECVFNNKLGKCVKLRITEQLERAREVDFDRTFSKQEDLVKSINYRYAIKHGLIKQLEQQGEKSGKVFTVDKDNFITTNPPCDFGEIIKHTKYLGSGVYGHAFQICPDPSCSPEFVLKLIPYQIPDGSSSPDWNNDKLQITNSLRGENVEVLQPTYLNSILIPNDRHIISPHISLPVMAFRCRYQTDSIQQLLQKIKSRDPSKYQNTKEIYQDTLHYKDINPDQEILVYVSEFARKGDVLNWLTKSKPSEYEVSIFLFQLIYTFACIQVINPTFRHNDLSLPNVLIQNIEIPDEYRGHYYHYQFRDHHYLIPITNFSLRLWDMDFSNSSSVPNRKVFCDSSQNDNTGLTSKQKCRHLINNYQEYGIIKETCLQYDLCFFFTYFSKFTDFYDRLPKSSSLKKYINSWSKFKSYDDPEIVANYRLTERAQTRYLDPSNGIPETQQITTICHQDGKSITIPYHQFTPEHSLTHCELFSHYKISVERLAELEKDGLILANYIFT